jgi:hypothetical protein
MPAELKQLPAADFAWEGNGPSGAVSVGIERKTVTDALSCMTGGRFAGFQLPSLLRVYRYPYLLLEGVWRASPVDGILEMPCRRGARCPSGWIPAATGRSRYMAEAFESWLLSLCTLTPLRLLHTRDMAGTVSLLHTMYRWWGKRWGDHNSLKVVYQPMSPVAIPAGNAGLVRRIAAQFRHLGWERSADVALRFKTPLDFALDALDGGAMLADVPGIGDVIRDSVVRQWMGDETEKEKQIC